MMATCLIGSVNIYLNVVHHCLMLPVLPLAWWNLRTLKRCSMHSAPGMDGITCYHLHHLPSSHHVLATLFNKLLEATTALLSWGSARINLSTKLETLMVHQIFDLLQSPLWLENYFIKFWVIVSRCIWGQIM